MPSALAALLRHVPQAPTPVPKLDPDRFRLLKKPLDGGLCGADPTAPQRSK